MAIREINGGYYVEVFLGIDPITEKKDRKTKTFKPKSRENLKKAKAWETKTLEAYMNGELTLKGDIPLADYLDEWYEKFIKDKKAYTTQQRYNRHIKCIKEHLGKVRLIKLKTKMVDDFYTKLEKEMKTFKNGKIKRRYSNGTILQVHKLFRMAIEQAETWEMIPKNYVNSATPPGNDTPETKSWSLNVTNEFFEYIKGEKIYTAAFIALHSGLREGEVAALRFQDIDFDKYIMTINHTLVDKHGIGLELEEPKTESSKDIVVMTGELNKMLKSIELEYKKHKLKTGIDLEYVCGWEDGRPLRPSYISKRFSLLAKKYAEKKSIDPITFHGLRHSHATILYEAGATSQEISKRLRHSRVSITDDIYIHVKEEIKKSTAQIFDRAVEEAKKI